MPVCENFTRTQDWSIRALLDCLADIGGLEPHV